MERSLLACEWRSAEDGTVDLRVAVSLVQGKVILAREGSAKVLCAPPREKEVEEEEKPKRKKGKKEEEGEGESKEEKEGAAPDVGEGGDNQEEQEESLVASLCFSPDGAHLAVGGPDRVLRLWSADDFSLVLEREANRRISAGCFTPVSYENPGRSSAALVADKAGDVYVVPKGPSGEGAREPPQFILGHTSAIITCMCSATYSSAEGEKRFILTGDRNDQVRVTRFPQVSIIESFLMGHEAPLTAVETVPKSDGLALTAGLDGYVGLWRIASGERLAWVRLGRGAKGIERHKNQGDDKDNELQASHVISLSICRSSGVIAAALEKGSSIVLLRWSSGERDSSRLQITGRIDLKPKEEAVAVAFVGGREESDVGSTLLAVVHGGGSCVRSYSVQVDGTGGEEQSAKSCAASRVAESLSALASESGWTSAVPGERLMDQGGILRKQCNKTDWNKWKDRKYKASTSGKGNKNKKRKKTMETPSGGDGDGSEESS